jgi:hypothetical protein
MMAAPTACARAPMRTPAPPDVAAQTLPTTNTAMPMRNRRFRPNRSASLPVDSSSAASSTA